MKPCLHGPVQNIPLRTGVNPPVVGQNVPEAQTVAQELEQMRSWLQQIRDQRELEKLREIRTRYEAGDLDAIKEPQTGAKTAVTAITASASSLPRPEPPTKYAKANRAEYNRWERDCEGFFLKSPAHFTLQQQRVDFGVTYISEPLKTLWQAHCSASRRVVPE